MPKQNRKAMLFKIFKKIVLLFVIVTIFPLVTSMNFSLEDFILTKSDWELEKSQTSPTITVPPNLGKPFESYNHWQCFPMEYVDFMCIAITKSNLPEDSALSETYWIPDVSIEIGNKVWEITDDTKLFVGEPMDSWQNCQTQVKGWQNIFQDEIGICTYSAELPITSSSPDLESRTLYEIKSLHHRIQLFEEPKDEDNKN